MASNFCKKAQFYPHRDRYRAAQKAVVGHVHIGPELLYRVLDVMEVLVKFTQLLLNEKDYLVDPYSERKESAEELSRRVNHASI